MEHPLVPNLDDLSLEQLGTKISELHKKLGIAMRSGNGHLCNQIRMVLESYQNKHQAKLEETFRNTELEKKFDDIIDIA
jgi:hypothetical protein